MTHEGWIKEVDSYFPQGLADPNTLDLRNKLIELGPPESSEQNKL